MTRKMTQEQVFERWWAKHGPGDALFRKYPEQARLIARDFASTAFARGYDLGRKRERER